MSIEDRKGEELTEELERLQRELDREKRMQMRQRMDSLGKLAKDISHDINNFLATIMGNISLLKMDSETLSKAQNSYLLDAERCCKSTSEMTTRLQYLARRRNIDSSKVDVHDIIRNAINTLDKSINPLIEQRMELADQKIFIMCDPEELQRILMNIGLNSIKAIDARGIGTGGYILVRTFLEDLNADNHLYLPEGKYVHIHFEDNGEGMSEEVRKKAFEPLYTSRIKEKRGQGLGLSIVYSSVTLNMSGAVDIETRRGFGTTIHLFLPAIA